jgi:ribosomal protein S12 methylthiotransferase
MRAIKKKKNPSKGRLLRDDTPPYSYIKISEGCNKKCSYCAIPSIRGRFRSFPPEEIISDAERQIKNGKKELIFVSQDLLSYNWQGYRLKDLLRDIASIDGDFWMRLLYLNPYSITDEFISFLVEEKKILRYLDIPFQHSEENILRLMRRPGGRKSYLNLIKRLKDAMPDIAIRTTLIVGFPGESQSAFRGLLSFVEDAGFDRLGAFKYSKEEGTLASKLPGHIPEKVKNERFDTLMRLQAEISLRKNQALIGSTFRALFDTPSEARIYSQAPEIDGITIVKGEKKAGRFYNLRIIGAQEYDLLAEPL